MPPGNPHYNTPTRQLYPGFPRNPFDSSLFSLRLFQLNPEPPPPRDDGADAGNGFHGFDNGWQWVW